VWVILVYMIASTVLVLSAGRLSDQFGRKKAYIGGFVLFAAASLGAGFAATGTQLILWRILQGLGGSFLFANAAAIVMDGPASQIVDQSGNNALANFATNAAAGSFTINGFTATTVAAGQTIDVGSSTVIIPGSGLLPPIQSLLHSGYDNGGWDETGIISSAARADARYGVADINSGSAVTLKYQLVGDANGDGRVDFQDLLTVSRNFNQTGDWSAGDSASRPANAAAPTRPDSS